MPILLQLQRILRIFVKFIKKYKISAAEAEES
jgi:hypothetical protein